MPRKVKTDLKNIIVFLTAILCVVVFLLYFIFEDSNYLLLGSNAPDSSQDYIKVIDVGQGDSILIQSNGYTALVDTGPKENGLQLCDSLRENKIKSIDALVITHTHLDHVGGLSQLMESFNVKNLVLPKLSTFSEGINAAELAINNVNRSGGKVLTAKEGFNFIIGEFELTVIADYSDFFNENNCSLVLMVKKDDRKMLLTADLEQGGEKRLLRKGVNISCDILKVGHHGSSSSTIKSFLSACNPQIAAISCGEGNEFAHPHTAVLNRLKNHRVKTYRTDKNGDITFFFENNKISVQTEK